MKTNPGEFARFKTKDKIMAEIEERFKKNNINLFESGRYFFSSALDQMREETLEEVEKIIKKRRDTIAEDWYQRAHEFNCILGDLDSLKGER